MASMVEQIPPALFAFIDPTTAAILKACQAVAPKVKEWVSTLTSIKH
jgi:hypothetical protein